MYRARARWRASARAVGLICVHHVGQLAALLGRYGLGRVEPDKAQIAILGQYFLDLRLYLALVAQRVVLACVVREVPVVRPAHAAVVVRTSIAAAVRVAPVQVLRIVQAAART